MTGPLDIYPPLGEPVYIALFINLVTPDNVVKFAWYHRIFVIDAWLWQWFCIVGSQSEQMRLLICEIKSGPVSNDVARVVIDLTRNLFVLAVDKTTLHRYSVCTSLWTGFGPFQINQILKGSYKKNWMKNLNRFWWNLVWLLLNVKRNKILLITMYSAGSCIF